MKPYRLTRLALSGGGLQPNGLVLTQDVRDAAGRIVITKGSRLTGSLIQRLSALEWNEVHAVELNAHDVHEIDAGSRLARAAAGRDVEVGAMTAGHWPLLSAARGVVSIDTAGLREINGLNGISLYTLFHGQVADAGETVARGKIVPFAIPVETLIHVERVAKERAGVVRMCRFAPTMVGAVIQESLGDRSMAKAHAVLAEKIGWFGSTLIAPRFVAPSGEELTAALREQIGHGARLLLIAGSRAMDPLDPAFEALAQLGARIERHGLPAHPGSLLWLGYLSSADGIGACTIVGLPSCGLFSQASVFDLLLPRILSGERLTNESLAELGHGGLLTRDMQFRFPPYRSGARRGEVLEE